MASTLALCLQRRKGTGEKPGHPLHNGESAGGLADSPNQHYYIIIAFLSLLLSLAFSIPLAWSHSSHRVYLMESHFSPLHLLYYMPSHTYYCICASLFRSSPSLQRILVLSFALLPPLESFLCSLKNSDNDFALETHHGYSPLLSCFKL